MGKPTYYFEWKWGRGVTYCVSKLQTHYKNDVVFYVFENHKGELTYQPKGVVDTCMEMGHWGDDNPSGLGFKNALKLITLQQYKQGILHKQMEAHLNGN